MAAYALRKSGSGSSPLPLRVSLHVPSCCVMQNEAKQHENNCGVLLEAGSSLSLM